MSAHLRPRRRAGRRALTAAVAAATLTIAPLVSAGAAHAADPDDVVDVATQSDGRFSIGALTGAVGTDSQAFRLSFSWPDTSTSFTTLRVDGVDTIYGSSSGTFTTPPDSTGGASTWTNGDISVTQRTDVVQNPLGGRRDTVRIRYEVTNTGSAEHAVGTRMMVDTQIASNDDAAFRVPGTGLVTTERDFTGDAVPNDFVAFDDLNDAKRVGAATLRGGEATVPDRLVLANWGQIQSTDWDYTINPERPTGDSAYATYWNPTALGAGQTRTYTSYYGLGSVSTDLTPPLALGLTGPTALTATPEGPSPNPFTATATLGSAEGATIEDVEATLDLPEGFTAEEDLTRDVGTVSPGAEQQVSWTITAPPSAIDRTVEYSVTASGTDAPAKTVRRELFIPANTSGSDTTTTVTTTPDGIVATVTAPGTAAPTGTVTFLVDDEEVGTAELVPVEGQDGTATATLTEPIDASADRTVTANYGGDTGFNESSDTYDRTNPTITAEVTTSETPNQAGWYNQPVTVEFTCTAGSAELVDECPSPVTRRNTMADTVISRSITATDGGADAVELPLKVDIRGPVLTVTQRGSAPYPRSAEPIGCEAADGRSGVRGGCLVTYGRVVTGDRGELRRPWTATAMDVAGNRSTRTGSFRIERG